MSTRQRRAIQTGSTSGNNGVGTAGAAVDAVQQQPNSFAAAAAAAWVSNGWMQRWNRQRQQQQQQAPLLTWLLTFRDPEVEFSYWCQRCEQQLLLLDRLVLLVNLLVLLNVASSRFSQLDLALHAVSLLLLIAQGAAMASKTDQYVRWRPVLVLMQRLWHAVLHFQQLQPTAMVAAAAAAAGLSDRVYTAPAATGEAVEAVAAAAACAAGQAAPAAANTTATKPLTALDSSPWQIVFDAAFVASGVAPIWGDAWAYQTPFGTAPLLQLCCLLLMVLADTGRLLKLLAAPRLQHCVAACYTTASALSSFLLLPLLPIASMPAALACPAMPALPVLLWLQLFWALAAPTYVTYCCERSSKVWYWLQRLAGMASVPDDVAQEAQGLLREVHPRHAMLHHAVVLLLLAALTWQACELAYWYLPDHVLRMLLHIQQ